MKITHRVPTTTPKSAVVDDRYQAEVDRATDSAEKRHQDAQKRLLAAERRRDRLQRAEVARSDRRKHAEQLKLAVALVEMRRAELEQIERMMQASPASLMHRGKGWHRPVPPINGSLLDP